MYFKRGLFIVSLCLGSSTVFAKVVTGNLVAGGGMDDMALSIKDSRGHITQAYCLNKCGKWFDVDSNDFSILKREYKNKKVVVDVESRLNRGAIAGPSDDEVFLFIKKINFVD